MKQSFLILLVSVSLCFGASRFILVSELRTDFAENGSTTQFLTGYTYDASGNRIQSRVWSGSDSTAAPMSSVKFTYDGNGAVTEALQLAGADTLTIVRYAYGNGKLLAVRTLRKDGTLRFTDSLIYDGQGRNVEEQRISSAGVITFYHHYTLNAQGKILADSLFEIVTGSYVASQAVLFTYNANSTVASEAQWQLSGASWYCISTGFMGYAAGSLVSVATHVRDGVGTGMTDSLAYTYDVNGNRTKEEEYDGSKALTHRIVYTWRDTLPTIVLVSEKQRNDQRFALTSKHGRLTADLPSQDRGVLTIFDMAGQRVWRMAVDHSGTVPLNGLIGKGRYIAVFASGPNRQTINFTLYN